MDKPPAPPRNIFPEAYLWHVIDGDTPKVLVPMTPSEYGIWAVISIRVRGLKAPESWTEEGKRLTAAVREQVLRRWTPLLVHTYSRSFTRYQGDLWLPDGRSYRELCEDLMEEMDIEQGVL